jgi:hypothetical protein
MKTLSLWIVLAIVVAAAVTACGGNPNEHGGSSPAGSAKPGVVTILGPGR